jgi:hypothetical protein
VNIEAVWRITEEIPPIGHDWYYEDAGPGFFRWIDSHSGRKAFPGTLMQA